MKKNLLHTAWTNVQVAVLFCGLIISLTSVKSQSAPNIQILEIIPSADNSTEHVRYLDKPRNSEIIVGQDVSPNSRLVIKCNATFPVQFIYIGAGRPEFSTYTNVQWREDPDVPLTFEAEVSLGLLGFQGALREEDTGNYSCRSIQNSTVLSYFYVYVPGPSLFTPPDGYDTELYITSKDKNVRIPCSVAHPKAVVSLFKTSNGKLQCPALEQNSATYDNKKGFLLNLKDAKSAGTYVCVASYDNSFRMIEYQVIHSNSSEAGGGKNPCRPSPCGKKAECSIVDGSPVCYCFRGLSGNPYSECLANDKKRCQTSQDCSNGLFCSQGQCTKDPCSPSPCGKGSQCQSFNGRPRCSCQNGFVGQAPYCRKKCVSNFECPQDEICTRNLCTSPCPGSCGKDAECQVIQEGGNKRPICTCPLGFVGDPSKECLALSRPPSQCIRNSDCPLGESCVNLKCQKTPPIGNQCPIGTCGRNALCQISQRSRINQPECFCAPDRTGDPNIECYPISNPTDQCSVNICGINAICSLSQNQRPECLCPPQTIGNPYEECFEQCPVDVCGWNAVCKVSRRRRTGEAEYDCTCPVGTQGNPNEECFNQTTGNDLCSRNNVCPPGSMCRINSRGDVNCMCPSGFNGTPPNCRPEPQNCREDEDCPREKECLGGLCMDSCYGVCGVNAKCSSQICTCLEGYKGDPYSMCSAPGQGTTRDPCNPSPCVEFAECKTMYGLPACRCILGYEGDGFRKCSPKETTQYPDKTFRPEFSDDSGFNLRQSGTQFQRERYPTAVVTDQRDECDIFLQRESRIGECQRGLQCQRDFDGVARCIPPKSNSQPTANCRDDRDCFEPDLCFNSTCSNSCDHLNIQCASVPFSECRIIEGKALCTCKRGYVGNPLSGLACRPEGNLEIPIVPCDMRRQLGLGKGSSGCDTRSECSIINGRTICVCGSEYVGNYPDCRLKCRSDLDCPDVHSCMQYQCVNPCDNPNACGNNAMCRATDHKMRCKCKPDFSGNPWKECFPMRRVRPRGLSMNCTGKRCTFF